jgi:hypothetical protein
MKKRQQGRLRQTGPAGGVGPAGVPEAHQTKRGMIVEALH